MGWLLVLAFALPVPAVSPGQSTAWRVTWHHPVADMLSGGVSGGIVAVYAAPLLLGVILITLAARRPWLAMLLSLLPWLLFPLAARTGQTLLLAARQHNAWWILAALSLLWVGARTAILPLRERLLRGASIAGVLLLLAWLFLPGFNQTMPHSPLVRLPFTLIRTGVPAERILGLGLLLAEVSWLLAGAQCVLEWLGVSMFSRRDRRQTLALSMVFLVAGIFFSELVSVILRANEAPQAQGWVLVSLALSRLKAWLTLAPMFALLPLSWDAWLQRVEERKID